MTDALLRSRVQPWASWVHSHPFKLLLETHKTCQWIGPLGQGTEARERAHALENKRRRIYLPILFLSRTQEILGRQSFLTQGGGPLQHGARTLLLTRGNVWVVRGNWCSLPHCLERGKFRVLGSSPPSATSFLRHSGLFLGCGFPST